MNKNRTTAGPCVRLTYRQRVVASRRGAILPLVAILLPVLLILASFVINAGYMELTRTELRITSDSATRAAGHALMTTGSQDQARQAARDAAGRNRVAGQPTLIADSDIVFGVSTRNSLGERYTFVPGGAKVNAVSVNARRDAGSLSGMVNLVFPTFGAVSKFGPSQLAVSSQVELDVALVLDRSGSMAYGAFEASETMAAAGKPPASAPPGWKFCDPAPPGSRWLDLVGATNTFLSVLAASPQEEHVCVSTYSDGATRETNLSGNYAAIPVAMDKYTKQYCMGFTNISAGIVDGINGLNNAKLSRPWAVKVIILLTDGRQTAGPPCEAAAKQAFDNGITIYTVTFSEEADQPRMEAIAKIGGGQHFHAASGADLKDVFKTIAGSLPTLLTK